MPCLGADRRGVSGCNCSGFAAGIGVRASVLKY